MYSNDVTFRSCAEKWWLSEVFGHDWLCKVFLFYFQPGKQCGQQQKSSLYHRFIGETASNMKHMLWILNRVAVNCNWTGQTFHRMLLIINYMLIQFCFRNRPLPSIHHQQSSFFSQTKHSTFLDTTCVGQWLPTPKPWKYTKELLSDHPDTNFAIALLLSCNDVPSLLLVSCNDNLLTHKNTHACWKYFLCNSI